MNFSSGLLYIFMIHSTAIFEIICTYLTFIFFFPSSFVLFGLSSFLIKVQEPFPVFVSQELMAIKARVQELEMEEQTERMKEEEDRCDAEDMHSSSQPGETYSLWFYIKKM